MAHNRPAELERPRPVFAKMLQEPSGRQRGEISAMMTYLFQGWNWRGPAKYKDVEGARTAAGENDRKSGETGLR